MEPRLLLAADIHFGAVYFEPASGDDTVPNVIEVTFEGGVPGTQLHQIVIDTDKMATGKYDTGDVFFDTEEGGMGVYGHHPFTVLSNDGFLVTGYSVVDGGLQLVIHLEGFDAGEKLVFAIDVDEINYFDPSTGEMDMSPLVEGVEFQRSRITGTFVAQHFETLELTATFWDFYDANFDAAAAATGSVLDLPPDRYSDDPEQDMSDRTAGAVAHAPQVAIPASLSGYVYHDRNNDGIRDAGEEGIAGVTVQVEIITAVDGSTGTFTVVTDQHGFWEVTDLVAGEYRVIEFQPDGWLDGKDAAGTVSGVTVGHVAASDHLAGVVLAGGDAGIEYNFGELKPAGISGMVFADMDGDCQFTPGDIPLEGVRIDLMDKHGVVISTTHTNAAGFYIFAGLVPDEYQVFEHQPEGYFSGKANVGSAGGQADGDLIYGIMLGSGVQAVHYDFCEKLPASLSGYVYHDRNNDGIRDPGEEGIAAVTLKLLDANGKPLGITVVTDAQGYYEFTGLKAGTYGVEQVHPEGWIDGLDTPGTHGGSAHNPGDMIVGAVLQYGQDALNYNFGELLPGSIQGRVIADTNGNCILDPGDWPLAGVTIELLDDMGQVVITTTTNNEGYYQFTGLAPGIYSVREIQPEGYFHASQKVGSGGGIVLGQDHVGEIHLGSDMHLIDYNFCEIPPAAISGYVFQDGPTIHTADGQPPDNLYEIRDGQRKEGDAPIAGVVLELRHGITGQAIDASVALPGYYASGPITAVTDENGYYEFLGLPPGMYAVYQVHPDGYVDFLDTAGSLGGLAVNAIDPISPLILSQLTVDPQFDAIIRILLFPNQMSVENNFSEVRIESLPAPPETPPVLLLPPERPPAESPLVAPHVPALLAPPVLPPQNLMPPPPALPEGAGVPGYTWHLSVIDAGNPRDPQSGEAMMRMASTRFDVTNWQGDPLQDSLWLLKREGENEEDVQERLRLVFGSPEAIPVTGDFNGDGTTDIGVFIDGEWFIDLNGNGVWDEGDLWAKLGTGDDQPVTGDWNGDGKTDIGIFGPAWPGDPVAIQHEPGLPDPQNQRVAVRKKNLPPKLHEAAHGHRAMKLTSQGKIRTDLIDHVFHYGAPGDRAVTGDWNGDGIHTIGVFRDGVWHLDLDGDGRFTERDTSFNFGQAGDIPVVGDWNGDGSDKVGVYRNGLWILDINNNRQVDAHDKVFELGDADALPVVGDWNGDGIDQPGLYRARAL